ncbi:MAG: hypothetical protein WDK96_01415 [Candidatus Paceibacterota bacterium]|jgi:hypothetical protein
MEEEKPIFSIGDKGIEMNPRKGDSIITNGDKIFMQNTKQNVDGGIIKHSATQNLTQIGNTMNAFNGGKIINKIETDKIENKKTIGILNQGKNNKFINNTFENLDIGIKDEGENTKALGNSFQKNIDTNFKLAWYQIWWVKYIIFPLVVLLFGSFLILKLGLNK